MATVKESRVRENLTHGLIERTEVAKPLSTLQRGNPRNEMERRDWQ